MINFKYIFNKIKNKKCKIGVIGLGYVGLPLSVLIAKKKFKVYGYDQDINKIKILNSKKSYINHIDKKNIEKVITSKNLIPTNNFADLKNLEIIIICLPTPLTHSKKPDLSFLTNVSKKPSLVGVIFSTCVDKSGFVIKMNT